MKSILFASDARESDPNWIPFLPIPRQENAELAQQCEGGRKVLQPVFTALSLFLLENKLRNFWKNSSFLSASARIGY